MPSRLAGVRGANLGCGRRYASHMAPRIYGTKDVPGRMHPVLDISRWEREFPLKDDDRPYFYCIDSTEELAHREQAIRRAQAQGDLGPSVPADVFVWADTELRDSPWLTRIGGRPWRPKGRPWPKDDHGVPLAFLGQICFVDSADTLSCELPGDVALIFGTNHTGWISLSEGSALEWSPLKIETPQDLSGIPWTGQLPHQYQGVLHRTVQYTDWKVAAPVFESLGYEEGGNSLHSIQATSIGSYADLPQGWPLENGESLIATLSSFYPGGNGALCDVRSWGFEALDGEGRPTRMSNRLQEFGIGDVGCIWIYRDKFGEFKLDGGCG